MYSSQEKAAFLAARESGRDAVVWGAGRGEQVGARGKEIQAPTPTMLPPV